MFSDRVRWRELASWQNRDIFSAREGSMPGISTSTRMKPTTTFKTLIILLFVVMTSLLEQAVNAMRDLPANVQDALAQLLLQFAVIDQTPLELSGEDAASLDESVAQADRGDFATDEQVRTIWAKHGL